MKARLFHESAFKRTVIFYFPSRATNSVSEGLGESKTSPAEMIPSIELNSIVTQANEQSADSTLIPNLPLDLIEAVSCDGWLLPPLADEMRGRKTLVVDLDETLIHSSFKPISNASIVLPVSF